MIKLYILYIVLGLYMLYNSLMLWVFPVEEAALQTDVAILASFILYFIAPAVSIYKPGKATIWGLIGLLGISPFGIHLLQYRLADEYFLMWSTENILMYVAILWYLVTLIVTINIFTQRYNLKTPYYNNVLKFSLSILPLIVIIALAVYFAG